MEFIDRIGIELEAGVGSRSDLPHFHYFNVTRDGSLRFRDRTVDNVEFVSRPINYPEKTSNLGDSVNRLYQYIEEVNDSTGLHVHVSFNQDADYQRLASKQFHDWFTDQLRDSELWRVRRLQARVRDYEESYESVIGHSCGRYCQAISEADTIDRQLRNGGAVGSNRYYRMAFRDSTVEFRLFPAFEEPSNVMKAVEFTTEKIREYLERELYKDQFSTSAKTDGEKVVRRV